MARILLFVPASQDRGEVQKNEPRSARAGGVGDFWFDPYPLQREAAYAYYAYDYYNRVSGSSEVEGAEVGEVHGSAGQTQVRNAGAIESQAIALHKLYERTISTFTPLS
ncbi:MAG: hypothetical protein QM803_18335 [Rhodocyclaceae bacterium]